MSSFRNLHAKRKRRAKRTVLCVGEGPTEKAFLDYVKSLYLSRNSGTSVTNRSGDGGSPDSVIRKALKWRKFDAFDKIYIVLDSDRTISSSSQSKVRVAKGTIILSEPCIEGLFLLILNCQGFNQRYHNSGWCKSRFHSLYLSEADKMCTHRYNSIFPKNLFDRRRNDIDTLNSIISIYDV